MYHIDVFIIIGVCFKFSCQVVSNIHKIFIKSILYDQRIIDFRGIDLKSFAHGMPVFVFTNDVFDNQPRFI